jgi:hypothetical protein
MSVAASCFAKPLAILIIGAGKSPLPESIFGHRIDAKDLAVWGMMLT